MYDRFFNFAIERQRIYNAKQAGLPRDGWTADPILSQYRFTNVFRENDATTVWFREKVRDPLRNIPEVLLATVVFRWFNRITTGEAIFCQLGDYSSRGRALTAFNDYLYTRDTSSLKRAILSYCGDGPYVTGAYIIKTPDGMNKLDGVLQCIQWFMEQEHDLSERKHNAVVGWRDAADWMEDGRVSLEQAWAWLRQFPFLGDFMAYEIVTDLRHTARLDQAPDILTWANPGPGAMRGLNRIHGRDLKYTQNKYLFITEMRDILASVRDYWPQSWPDWEMREVEHTLCEFDKYERVRLGQGRPRGVYR